MITGYVCKSSVERVERVVRGLVDAGLAQTAISIVYPCRSTRMRRGEFAGSSSRRQDFTPELASLVHEGLVLVQLEQLRTGPTEFDVSKALARSDECAEERDVSGGDLADDVLLVVRCSDDSSCRRGASVFAAAGGVWSEESEGVSNSNVAAAKSADRRNEDA